MVVQTECVLSIQRTQLLCLKRRVQWLSSEACLTSSVSTQPGGIIISHFLMLELELIMLIAESHESH